MAQATGEKIIYGFLRSKKTLTLTVSDDAVGQITAVTNTGDPQVWSFETLRGKGGVQFGPIHGDVDFVMYINSGVLTYDYAVNDFIVESERSITNGVVEQATGGGSGNTNLSATYTATTATVVSDSGNDATLNGATTTLAGLMTSADKTKLNGIATAATANDTDANLKNRANHTGTQTAATISDFATAADARITAQKGANSGLASLDSTGKVPTGQLPSYVSDVFEYANKAAFPATGTANKIYVAIDTSKSWRWSGSTYVEVSPSEVNSVNGRTGAVVIATTDVLTASQTSAGATHVIGTNADNELINKDGGKEFKATIIPRNMTLASLTSLVNGGGEIASSSDTEHLVKLHGTPGSGVAYVFHPMGVNSYDYKNNTMISGNTGGGTNWTFRNAFFDASKLTNVGSVANWSDLSRAQKDAYCAPTNIQSGITYGTTSDSVGGWTASVDAATIFLKQRPANWNGTTNFVKGATPLETNTGTFQICDEAYKPVMMASIQEAYGVYQINIGGAGNGHVVESAIGDSVGKLAFFNDDPSAGVVKRTPANIGTGGSRVGTTGNAVTDAATFTGGVGSTAYTIGQVVAALKQLGLLTT